MTLTPALVDALALDNQTPEGYRPAYNGESVGLDLYNAGPNFAIPSVLSMPNAYDLYSMADDPEIKTWLDIPERLRKAVFKKLMPTGVKTVIPVGYVGIIKERGSITKSPLLSRAGVIDPGYSGEIFVNMVNVSPELMTINAGAKSPFQLVVMACTSFYKIVDEEEFQRLHASTQRAEGLIGSSD